MSDPQTMNQLFAAAYRHRRKGWIEAIQYGQLLVAQYTASESCRKAIAAILLAMVEEGNARYGEEEVDECS